MSAVLDVDAFFAARLGFVAGYGAVAGCCAFAVLCVLRLVGLRAKRPGAWRREAALALVTAIAVAMVNWFVRSSPTVPSLSPPGMRTCRAIATNDGWTFVHPGDTQSVAGVLWAEIDVPLQVVPQLGAGVTTPRCFAVPAMRAHRDAVPGLFQSTWFTPTELGDFVVEPSHDCPNANGSPRAILRVVDSATWQRSPWR